TAAVECPLTAGEIASLARSLTGSGSFNGFVDDLAADGRILIEVGAQALIDECLHDASDIGIQLALGLAFKLRLRELHADDGDQAFADVVAGEVFLYVLEQSELLSGVVDGASEGGAEAGEMRATVNRVDVVGE